MSRLPKTYDDYDALVRMGPPGESARSEAARGRRRRALNDEVRARNALLRSASRSWTETAAREAAYRKAVVAANKARREIRALALQREARART